MSNNKTTFGRMVEDIKERIVNGEELKDIEDQQNEFVDGFLPIYYNDILNEWRDMPSEYNDRGADEGIAEGGIYNLMTADLYFYYSDIFQEALAVVKSDLEEAEEAAESETPEKQYLAACGHDDVLGYMSNTVCGKCARLNHKKAIGK